MRVFISVILFVVFVLSLIYLLLFTSGGNNLLKPYVEKEIAKRIDHNVSISSMTLKPNFVDFEMLVDQKSKLVLNGNINLFKQSFNLNYEVDANNLKTPYMYIKNHLQFNGKLAGNLKEYSINGKGEALMAKTVFLVSMKNKKIKKLEIDAKNVRIEEILSILNKPIYTQGMLDIYINLNSSDGSDFNGTAKSIVHYGVLNNQEIQKDFGIKFDNPINYRGKINSQIKDDVVYSDGEIFSNIAQLNFKQSKYNIANKNLFTNFDILLPNLELLKPITKQKLSGNLRFTGDLEIKDKIINLKAKSKKFGGNINISVLGKSAKVNVSNLRSQEIFKMLNMPWYFNAKVDGDVDCSDINTLDMQTDLRIHEGKISVDNFKTLTGIELPENNSFSLHVNSIKSDNNVTLKSDFVSNIFSLKNDDIKYNINTKTYAGDYRLGINKLSNIEFLTKTKLRGRLDLNGTFFAQKDEFKVDGSSNFLDSNSTFTYKDNILKINLANISSLRLSHMAFMSEIFDSTVQANAVYNVLNKKGKFDAIANDGRLKKGDFSDLIFAITKFDLTQELFDKTTLDGSINANNVNFSLVMHSKNSSFTMPKGHVDLSNRQIDSNFNINVDKKDLSGEVKGSIYQPKINIRSSQYIKDKIEKIIDKKVPQDLKKPLKDLLKLFG